MVCQSVELSLLDNFRGNNEVIWILLVLFASLWLRIYSSGDMVL